MDKDVFKIGEYILNSMPHRRLLTHSRNTKILNGLRSILNNWLSQQTFTFNNSALFFKAYTDLKFFSEGISIILIPTESNFMYFSHPETNPNINEVVNLNQHKHYVNSYARDYLFQNSYSFKDTFHECFAALLHDYLEGNQLAILNLEISLFILYTEISLFCLKHEIDTVYFTIIVS